MREIGLKRLDRARRRVSGPEGSAALEDGSLRRAWLIKSEAGAPPRENSHACWNETAVAVVAVVPQATACARVLRSGCFGLVLLVLLVLQCIGT